MQGWTISLSIHHLRIADVFRGLATIPGHWPMAARQWPGSGGQMRARFVWPQLPAWPRPSSRARTGAQRAPEHSSSLLPAATVLPLNWARPG